MTHFLQLGHIPSMTDNLSKQPQQLGTKHSRGREGHFTYAILTNAKEKSERIFTPNSGSENEVPLKKKEDRYLSRKSH